MGFGHRVYKNYDPRAKIIKKAADDVFEVTGVNPLLEIALELEKIALEDEYFIERKLYPNVDFYSGLIYEALGLPVDDVPGACSRSRARAAGSPSGSSWSTTRSRRSPARARSTPASAGATTSGSATALELSEHSHSGEAPRRLPSVRAHSPPRRNPAHRPAHQAGGQGAAHGRPRAAVAGVAPEALPAARSRASRVAELRYLTEIDGVDHVAYVALRGDAPKELVARRAARARRRASRARGDRGGGRRLLAAPRRRHVCSATCSPRPPATADIRWLTATMASDNVAAHRLFDHVSTQLRAPPRGRASTSCGPTSPPRSGSFRAHRLEADHPRGLARGARATRRR